MARPVAGVRSKTLIITLPGSPKGAKENLLAVLKLLPHACLQAAGGNSRTLHAGGVEKLEKEAGLDSAAKSQHHHHDHGHSHGHHGHTVPKAHTNPGDSPISNDPRAGPTQRYRESPYPMLSVEEAVKLVIDYTPAPTPVQVPVNGSLVGHVLAEDVQAEEAVPAYRASIVDGYALNIHDIVEKGGIKRDPRKFLVVSVSHPSPSEAPAVQSGEVARITTGAPLPPSAVAVVMVEDTTITKASPDGQEEQEIEILTNDIKLCENVREIGSDIKAGEIILRKGEQITAVGGELGLLASIGKPHVSVYKKPTIGVLSTGDEIIKHNRPGPLRPGEVRDCNRPTILAAVESWGFETTDLGIAADTPGALEETLRAAMRRVDFIITTGGVSMGELDLLKPTVERALGGTIHFGRVAMKPGKPTTFATVPFKRTEGGARETRLIFSLPGNPASAVTTLHLFVLPSLQLNSGLPPAEVGLPKVLVILDEKLKCDARRAEFHRARASMGKDGRLHAVSTGGQRSSRVGSFRGANCLVRLPAREGVVGRGDEVEGYMMGVIGGL
jgi:gephyrin